MFELENDIVKKKERLLNNSLYPMGFSFSYEYEDLQYYIDKIRVFGPFTNDFEIGDSLEQFINFEDNYQLMITIFERIQESVRYGDFTKVILIDILIFGSLWIFFK